MARKRKTGVKRKGKRTAFSRCVGGKLKGKKFKTRTSQRAAFRKAVKSCAKKY